MAARRRENPWYGALYRKHYVFLLDNMDGEVMHSACLAQQLIVASQRQTLASITVPREHNARLLSILEGGNKDTFLMFREILRKHGNRFTFKAVLRDFDTIEPRPKGAGSEDLDETDGVPGKGTLLPNPWYDQRYPPLHLWLSQNLDPDLVRMHCFCKLLVTGDQVKKLQTKTAQGPLMHNNALLEILMGGGRGSFETFLKVLALMHGFDDKRQEMEEILKSS